MKNMNSPAFSKITKLSRSFSLLFRKGSICASMQSWAYRRPRLYNEDNEIGWSGSRRTSEQAGTPIRPARLPLQHSTEVTDKLMKNTMSAPSKACNRQSVKVRHDQSLTSRSLPNVHLWRQRNG